MKTILSRKTKAFVARDQDGSLYIYPGNRPKKDESGVWDNHGLLDRIDRDLFPEVKWEDEEPTIIDIEVSCKIK